MLKLLKELQRLNEAEEPVVQSQPAAPQSTAPQTPQPQVSQPVQHTTTVPADAHLKIQRDTTIRMVSGFNEMTVRQKLHTLDKMYVAGQKLLLHIKQSQQANVQVKNPDGTVSTEVHFDEKEKGKLISRVLLGFKSLKQHTLLVVQQLDAEEQAYAASQQQVVH